VPRNFSKSERRDLSSGFHRRRTRRKAVRCNDNNIELHGKGIASTSFLLQVDTSEFLSAIGDIRDSRDRRGKAARPRRYTI